MKILQIHNRYKQLGGEDTVLSLERDLLLKNGHQVNTYQATNEEVETQSFLSKIKLGLNTIWSRKSYKRIVKELKVQKPDIVHVHNTFPLLSPSIYWAINKFKIPVVLTLHNYRLICSNALLMRNDLPCEKCVGNLGTKGLFYRCYRNSFTTTLPIFLMKILHKILGTYRNKIDAFITLTEFSKSLFIKDGIPEKKIYVKPNFLKTDTTDIIQPSKRKDIVFVGRISNEKGVDLLLEAWAKLNVNSNDNLIIVGDGPEKSKLEKQYNLHNIKWLGWQDRDNILKIVSKSKYLIMTSKWYEGFPLVLLEAMSVGVPLIVPYHAGFPEIVQEGKNGFLFKPNDIQSISLTIEKAISLWDDQYDSQCMNSKENFENNYSSHINFTMLLEIYSNAIKSIDYAWYK
tara:strand:+ start:1288 stop:2490 length:1203 start_codon:yes stop_codon:yes gene_type:complete